MDMCIITRARPPTMMGMFTITEGGPVPPSPCQTAIIIMSFRDKPLTTTDTFITIGGLRAKRLDETEVGTKRLWMGCESILDSPFSCVHPPGAAFSPGVGVKGLGSYETSNFLYFVEGFLRPQFVYPCHAFCPLSNGFGGLGFFCRKNKKEGFILNKSESSGKDERHVKSVSAKRPEIPKRNGT